VHLIESGLNGLTVVDSLPNYENRITKASTAMSTSQFDRRTSTSPSPATFKFPELSEDMLQTTQEAYESTPASPMPQPLGLPNHMHSHERWQARRGSSNVNGWTPNAGGPVGRHGRQKSLSEAIRTVRGRRGSVTQNAHEIADALKAPVSGRLIVRCSSNTIAFPCLLFGPSSSVPSGIRPRSCPTLRPRPS
jgi:hypothetical protein